MCDPWTLASACDSAAWNYRFDHEAQLVAAVLTLLWATYFVHSWRRDQATLTVRWGLACEGDDTESDSDDYCDECEKRPWKRGTWLLLSLLGLAALLALVMGAVVALIMVRILLYGMFKSFGELILNF